MRDEKDPGTIEMVLSKKRGRPARHGRAMTDAERAHEYRLRRASRADHALRVIHKGEGTQVAAFGLTDDAVLLDALRTAMAADNRLAVHVITDEIRRRYRSK
jgi:hypothetical protein